MTHTTTQEFDVLHALRVRGLAVVEPLAESVGRPADEVQAVLTDLVDRGLAKCRTGGKLQGYMLTASGRSRHLELRDDEVDEQSRAALAPAYEAFLSPNRSFKEVTTVWQLEAAGDISAVLPRLEAVHAAVTDVLVTAAGAVPRLSGYQPRLDRALASFRDGDGGALARPMSGSYHDVWMELHEDLLLTMGRERSDADE